MSTKTRLKQIEKKTGRRKSQAAFVLLKDDIYTFEGRTITEQEYQAMQAEREVILFVIQRASEVME